MEHKEKFNNVHWNTYLQSQLEISNKSLYFLASLIPFNVLVYNTNI